MLTLQQISRALGGEAYGKQVLVRGPGHSPRDRSLSIKLHVSAPDGFVVHSFAGDDPMLCKPVAPAVDRRQIASVASSASGTSPVSPLIIAPGAVNVAGRAKIK
jgi:hypothetical protein